MPLNEAGSTATLSVATVVKPGTKPRVSDWLMEGGRSSERTEGVAVDREAVAGGAEGESSRWLEESCPGHGYPGQAVGVSGATERRPVARHAMGVRVD